MPIYEYACPTCSNRFEAYVQSWREALPCPACGEEEVQKQLSTFAMKGASQGSGGCGCGRGACGCRG
jgi:putative FmdB family regulatory protein